MQRHVWWRSSETKTNLYQSLSIWRWANVHRAKPGTSRGNTRVQHAGMRYVLPSELTNICNSLYLIRLAYKSSFKSWTGSEKTIQNAGENRKRSARKRSESSFVSAGATYSREGLWESLPLRVSQGGGGGPCSLPKLPYVPMFPHSLRMFSYCNFSKFCSLFPKLANVPLFPSIFCQCSLVPQNPWETLTFTVWQFKVIWLIYSGSKC